MTRHSGEGQKAYFYSLNGRGSVTALIDQNAHVFEGYRYDVYGQPSLIAQNGQTVSTPLLTGGQLYDDTGFSVLGPVSYDPKTAQTVTERRQPGPWIDTYEVADDAQSEGGGMSGKAGVSIIGRGDPWEGGMSDEVQWWIEHAVFTVNLEPAIKILGWLRHHGIAHVIAHGVGHGIAHGFGKHGWSGMFYSFFIAPMMDPSFGNDVPGGGVGMPHRPGYGGHEGNSSGSGGSSSGGSSQGHGGSSSGGSSQGTGSSSQASSTSPSGRPEDAQPVNPDDKNKGDNSYTIQESSDYYTWDPKHPEKEGHWVEGKGGGGSNMPDPEDGTGEGIDKDWWRDMPYADPLSLAAALRSPLKFDEREQTPYLSLGSYKGIGYLVGALTPQPIKVDERGETLTLNLQGVQSTSTSAGISTSEGWGDKPRSLAEAYAAPRIRSASTSRF